MITAKEGGCIHRMMPPIDWDCGPIPPACYNKSLTSREIQSILEPIYLADDRVRRLANSDDEIELFKAKLALEILVEIDASTIRYYNIAGEQNKMT
jgi:hypothetical protein